jgi:uncharacterized membrane protein YciS (DUF1049 family)
MNTWMKKLGSGYNLYEGERDIGREMRKDYYLPFFKTVASREDLCSFLLMGFILFSYGFLLLALICSGVWLKNSEFVMLIENRN